MKYLYPEHRVTEIIKSPKRIREKEDFKISRKGDKGAYFDSNIDLVEGDFIDMRYLGKSHDLAVVEAYSANLILSAHRVRGVDYQSVGRRRFYKDRIPSGWHQNVIDPNKPTEDPNYNRHIPLEGFKPVDFNDFINKTSTLWNIDLLMDETML